MRHGELGDPPSYRRAHTGRQRVHFDREDEVTCDVCHQSIIGYGVRLFAMGARPDDPEVEGPVVHWECEP